MNNTLKVPISFYWLQRKSRQWLSCRQLHSLFCSRCAG